MACYNCIRLDLTWLMVQKSSLKLLQPHANDYYALFPVVLQVERFF